MASLESHRQAAPRSRSGFPGRYLVALLLALLVLAIVVPALLAWAMNAARVSRARDGANALAAFVAAEGSLWTTANGGAPTQRTGAPGVRLLGGPGDLPRLPASWSARRIDTLAAVLGPARLERLGADGVVVADPWQNAYLVVRLPLHPDAAWVVSAGPNGVLETDFESSPVGGGDDIVVPAKPRAWQH